MTHRTPSQEVANALPPGYRFNEFEIKDVIGTGSVSIVYRAWDHQLERTVAIKEFMPTSLALRGDNNALVLRSQRCGKAFAAGLNSFIQQARLLAQFNHPGLLHVLRFWVENDTAYMATVFYNGMTLSHLKHHYPDTINESWIRQMLPSLLEGLKTLHDSGYLHRDISPDNILIQENGLPVLLDFDCARSTTSNIADETETILRPGYAPIEQYTDDNESEQGPWTDIYALGAMLYTLITDTTPPVSVVRSVEDNYTPLSKLCPSGYSTALLQAVDHALALQPEDRPRSIEAFAELLRLPVEEEPPAIAPEHTPLTTVPLNVTQNVPPETITKNTRYRQPAIIAACLVAGIALGALLFKSFSRAPDASGNSATTAVAGSGQAIAHVYLQLREGSKLLINGKPYEQTAGPDGILTLHLKAGQYIFALQQNGVKRARSIIIEHPGTWFVTP